MEEELVGEVAPSQRCQRANAALRLHAITHCRCAPRHAAAPAAALRHCAPALPPTTGARWHSAAGKLPATPTTTGEAANLPFQAAPARILGELRHCLAS